MRYAWKSTGPQPRIAADVFGGVVERLAGGEPIHVVPPQAIVDEARPRKSPIHKLFPWDDEKAAEAHRRHVARRLLGQLEIVHVRMTGSRSSSTRAFFSVRIDDERGYVSRSHVLSNRDLKLQVISAATEELEYFVQKYGSVLGTFGNYISELSKIISDMRKEVERLTTEAIKPKKAA